MPRKDGRSRRHPACCAQGADWAELAGSERIAPIHYDGYTVFSSPLSDFTAEARIRAVDRGTRLPL